MTEQKNVTSTAWDLGAASITNVSEFTCSPPGEIIKAGEQRDQLSTYVCEGTSDTIAGITTSDVTFQSLGIALLEVESNQVPVFHYREIDTLTGPQRGITTLDYWYAAQDMLLVRMERHVDLRTDSPVGDITYKEDGEWQLSSLTPTR